MWRRHRAAWRVIRNAVASSHSRVGAWLIRTFGSPGRFAENGRSIFTCCGSGFGNGCVTPRRLAGGSRVLALSRTWSPVIAHSSDRPTGKWSRRARRSGAILSPRRAAHLQRWTDGRNQEHGSFQTKKRSHLAASRIGVICITSASDSRESSLLGGGALSSVSPGGRVNSRHEPSVRQRPLSRLVWSSDHDGVRVARRGSLARRRVRGAQSQRSGTVATVGFFRRRRHPSFKRCRSFGAWGSSRTAC